jgi:hypothetical protein
MYFALLFRVRWSGGSGRRGWGGRHFGRLSRLFAGHGNLQHGLAARAATLLSAEFVVNGKFSPALGTFDVYRHFPFP